MFQRLQQKLDDIRDKVHDIHDYIREQKIAQSNPLFAELDSQRRSLCNQRSKILKQQVLEFMTDEGLLPNYAFPEKGVTFEGSIRYQPQGAKNEGKKYYSENIELVRPASSALKELVDRCSAGCNRHIAFADQIRERILRINQVNSGRIAKAR